MIEGGVADGAGSGGGGEMQPGGADTVAVAAVAAQEVTVTTVAVEGPSDTRLQVPETASLSLSQGPSLLPGAGSLVGPGGLDEALLETVVAVSGQMETLHLANIVTSL